MYASGKYALAICDCCGFQVMLHSLSERIIMGQPSGVMVCRVCVEPDHPQRWAGRQQITDPEGLRNPRSDAPERDVSRQLIGTIDFSSYALGPITDFSIDIEVSACSVVITGAVPQVTV